MKPLFERVRWQELFPAGATVLVAVSGGADSVVLLDLMSRTGLPLAVAHLNHALRGAASDADQAFVADLAARYRLPFHTATVQVDRVARDERLSLEEAGREVRYRFLHDTAREIDAATIALAHHRDDQAETVLMRLLRGSGGSGLAAMGERSGLLRRPLLGVSRREIEEYLAGRGLCCRTDASNFDTTLLRNSIRHELIPFLTRYNPAVCARLAATARALAADEELLEEVTTRAFERHARVTEGGIALDRAGVAAEPPALRMRLYRRALDRVRGGLRRIGRTHLEALDRLVAAPRPQGSLSFPGGCTVERCYGEIRIVAAAVPAQPGWEVAVPGTGTHPLPCGGRLAVSLVPRPASLEAGSPTVAYLSPGAAPFPWLVRTFLPGDRFTPLGMTGGQKVKDFFINEKLEAGRRRRVPLVFSAGRLVWICGLRIGNEAAVGGAENTVLRVEILDLAP